MTTIAIHRMQVRLRVAAGDDGAAARLKRLLGDVLDHALERALQQRGLDGRGELCIRHLHVPVRLDLAASNSALVAEWAQRIAAAVAGSRALDGVDLVHYGSRAHALADLTLAAAAGDFTRAWAWHSLGLWPAAGAVTAADAAGLMLRALSAEPGHAVAALACLARDPPRFERWWRRASPLGLEALAGAVLLNAGDDAAPARAAAASAPAHRAWTWLRGSAIARAADRLAGHDARAHQSATPRPGWPASRALAVLALAEAEPARLLAPGDELAELLDVLAARWAPPDRTAPDAGSAAASRPQDRPPASTVAPQSPVAHEPGAEDAPAASLPARARAATAFGGLLFLLNLAAALDWPARWLADPVLAARGVRWGLYQLALRLLPPAGRHDPAALAFAGLLPDAAPPGADDPPPDGAEQAALDAVRGELLAALRARLPSAPADDAALLMLVCWREGAILADPGWLELHLSHDDVRTDVRVAGLDLDPAWVPWLGLVIRFVYG